MKKLSIFLIVPIMIFWFFPIVARAENNANTSALIEYVYNTFGVTMREDRANTICNNWETKYNLNDNWSLFAYQEDSSYLNFLLSNNYALSGQQSDGSFSTGVFQPGWTSYIYWIGNQTLSTNSNGTSTINHANVYNLGDWGSFLINYDLYEYDPNIPDPHILIAYKENVSSNVPLVFQIDSNDDYFVECYARFYKGENYTVDQDGNFKVLSKYTSGLISILSKEERIGTNSFSGSMESNITSEWNTVISNHPYSLNGSSQYFEQSNAFSYLDDWLDLNENNLVLAGNQVQFYFRFWKLDENNNIKVGRWRTWYSKVQNEFTVNIPSWLQPYADAVGTDNQIVMPDPDLLPQLDPIGGTPTGGNTYITVNPNNVPNYPDYPTVVTYNHDNIFTQFIETARQLPQFFGETVSLFSGMFGFIPEWIWGIIGFGFLCNIVIMIVKVL